MTTRVAPRANEALRKHAAFQIRAKLRFDVPWQPAVVVLARVGKEALKVLADNRVQHRFGGPAWQVRRSECRHERLHTPGLVPRSPGRISRRKQRTSRDTATFDGGAVTALHRRHTPDAFVVAVCLRGESVVVEGATSSAQLSPRSFEGRPGRIDALGTRAPFTERAPAPRDVEADAPCLSSPKSLHEPGRLAGTVRDS